LSFDSAPNSFAYETLVPCPSGISNPFISIDAYEVRPCKDHRGVDLISDALVCDGLWYGGPNALQHAIGFAKFRSCSQDAVIRVYDEVGNVIETHEHKGEFKES